MERYCPHARLPLALTLLALVGLGPPRPGEAGVYRCTGAAGELYFSDVACPTGFEKEELAIESRRLGEQGNGSANAPDSLAEQVRRMEKPSRPEAPGHRATKKPKADGEPAGPDPADRYELDSIEDELATLDAKEKELREDTRFGTPIRKRWAREGLQELRTERRRLLRQRENILRTAR